VLRDLTTLERVRGCGRPLGHGYVTVKTIEYPDGSRSAGLGGLSTCGSVWACPCCSATIAARRQREVEQLLVRHTATGSSAALLTMTMRHHERQRLDALWDALSLAWSAATSGKRWKAERGGFGVTGYVRTVEVTHGEHGWHVHVHVLLLGDGMGDPLARTQLAAAMFARWRRALVRGGLDAPIAEKGGLDVRAVEAGTEGALADYLSKGVRAEVPDVIPDRRQARRAAVEVTRADLKTARRGNRTPWEILADVLTTGDADDLDLWREYEQASHGRRMQTWSRGLRGTYGLGAEDSDEDVAAEDRGGETIARLTAETYRAGTRTTPVFAALLLEAAETGGREGIDALLHTYGLPPSLPPPRQSH